MKKYAVILAGSLLLLSLVGCTAKSNTPVESSGSGTVQTNPAGEVIPESTKDYKETTAPPSTEKLPDKDAVPVDIISVYVPNEDATGLVKDLDSVDKLSAQSLVDKMAELGILEEGTQVLKYEAEDGVATLDLDRIPSSGTAGESIMLVAIGNMFTENMEVDKVRLLVNGENYSSGHIEFGDDDYLTYNSEYKKLGE